METNTITHLHELNETADNGFSETFTNSMHEIFQGSHSDITDTLTSRNVDLLLILRNKLCDQVKSTFPVLGSRTPVNRRAKHLVVKDICILADCLVKETHNNELDKVVFGHLTPEVSNGGPQEGTGTGNGDGLAVITGLMAGFQESIDNLIQENKRLKDAVDALATKKCSCVCPCNDMPKEADTSPEPPGDFVNHQASSEDSAGEQNNRANDNTSIKALTSSIKTPPDQKLLLLVIATLVKMSYMLVISTMRVPQSG